MRPSPETVPVLIEGAEALRGSQERLLMAGAVQAMGRGGQRWAEGHLGWCRDTVREGTHELRPGMTCVDAFPARRREPAEEHLPRLLGDIRAIVDGQCQADPKLRTDRLLIRISAAEVRRRLVAGGGYTDEQSPAQQAIDTRLNLLGYRPTKVAECRPRKGPRGPTPSSSG